jgi:hypothetical protein
MHKCNYCKGTIGVENRHSFSCPFKKDNNKKIMTYLESLVIENKRFCSRDYNKFARSQTPQLPLAMTILGLMRRNGWLDSTATTMDAFLYLIYRSYELGLVNDIEILDLLTYRISYGCFRLNTDEYLTRVDRIVEKTDYDLNTVDECRIAFIKYLLSET